MLLWILAILSISDHSSSSYIGSELPQYASYDNGTEDYSSSHEVRLAPLFPCPRITLWESNLINSYYFICSNPGHFIYPESCRLFLHCNRPYMKAIVGCCPPGWHFDEFFEACIGIEFSICNVVHANYAGSLSDSDEDYTIENLYPYHYDSHYNLTKYEDYGEAKINFGWDDYSRENENQNKEDHSFPSHSEEETGEWDGDRMSTILDVYGEKMDKLSPGGKTVKDKPGGTGGGNVVLGDSNPYPYRYNDNEDTSVESLTTDKENSNPLTDKEKERPKTDKETPGPTTDKETPGPVTYDETSRPTTSTEIPRTKTDKETSKPATITQTSPPITDKETPKPTTDQEIQWKTPYKETPKTTTDKETLRPTASTATPKQTTTTETPKLTASTATPKQTTTTETPKPTTSTETLKPTTSTEIPKRTTTTETPKQTTTTETPKQTTATETPKPTTSTEIPKPTTTTETPKQTTTTETPKPTTTTETPKPTTTTETPKPTTSTEIPKPITSTEIPKPTTSTEIPKPATTTETPKPTTSTENPKPTTTTETPKPTTDQEIPWKTPNKETSKTTTEIPNSINGVQKPNSSTDNETSNPLISTTMKDKLISTTTKLGISSSTVPGGTASTTISHKIESTSVKNVLGTTTIDGGTSLNSLNVDITSTTIHDRIRSTSKKYEIEANEPTWASPRPMDQVAEKVENAITDMPTSSPAPKYKQPPALVGIPAHPSKNMQHTNVQATGVKLEAATVVNAKSLEDDEESSENNINDLPPFPTTTATTDMPTPSPAPKYKKPPALVGIPAHPSKNMQQTDVQATGVKLESATVVNAKSLEDDEESSENNINALPTLSTTTATTQNHTSPDNSSLTQVDVTSRTAEISTTELAMGTDPTSKDVLCGSLRKLVKDPNCPPRGKRGRKNAKRGTSTSPATTMTTITPWRVQKSKTSSNTKKPKVGGKISNKMKGGVAEKVKIRAENYLNEMPTLATPSTVERPPVPQDLSADPSIDGKLSSVNVGEGTDAFQQTVNDAVPFIPSNTITNIAKRDLNSTLILKSSEVYISRRRRKKSHKRKSHRRKSAFRKRRRKSRILNFKPSDSVAKLLKQKLRLENLSADYEIIE